MKSYVRWIGCGAFETSCTLKGRLCSRARDRNVRMLRVSASSVAIQKESATLKHLELWGNFRITEEGEAALLEAKQVF